MWLDDPRFTLPRLLLFWWRLLRFWWCLLRFWWCFLQIFAIQFGEPFSNSTKGFLHFSRADGLAVFGNVTSSVPHAKDDKEVEDFSIAGGEVGILAMEVTEGNPNVVPSVLLPGLGLRNDALVIELHCNAEISEERVLGVSWQRHHGRGCGQRESKCVSKSELERCHIRDGSSATVLLVPEVWETS